MLLHKLFTYSGNFLQRVRSIPRRRRVYNNITFEKVHY